MREFQLQSDSPIPHAGRAGARADDVTGLSEEELGAFGEIEVQESIGQRIRLRREALSRARGKRFTQEELALAVGVTKGAVSQWEKDLWPPDKAIWNKVAAALDCSANWLFHGDGAPPDDMRVERAAPAIRGNLVIRETAESDRGDFVFTGHVAGYKRRPPGLLDSRPAYCLRMVGTAMAPPWEDGA